MSSTSIVIIDLNQGRKSMQNCGNLQIALRCRWSLTDLGLSNIAGGRYRQDEQLLKIIRAKFKK